MARLNASSDVFEDMDILLIGAAPAPDRSYGHEKDFRMFQSVQHDLHRMYNMCTDPDIDVLKSRATKSGATKSGANSGRSGVRGTSGRSGYLNVRRCLVNHKQLAPDPPPPSQQLERTNYKADTYNNVNEIRAYVKDFIESEVGPNLLIYFSGHGTYSDQHAAATEHGAIGPEESLTIPVHFYNGKTRREDTRRELYTASQLTADINEGMKRRAADADPEQCVAKVFIVIDACHAEGLVNMWSLDGNIRLKDFVVLFAGAETQLDAGWDKNGGEFTNAFAKYLRKGVKLSDLAQSILEELYDPQKISPCVRYSHPSLCDELLLKDAAIAKKSASTR